MAKVPTRKIQIAAGETFIDSAVWCEAPFVYKTISAVTAGWPTVLTATAHGIPAGVVIPVWISNARGITAINTTEDAPLYAERASDDTLTLVGFNTGGTGPYTASSGTLAYMAPKDLTGGWIARTQFRKSVSGDVLVEATTAGVSPAFALTGAIGKIVLTLTPTLSRALLGGGQAEQAGIAHVELESPSGEVFRPWDYVWKVTPEGTREV